ncbi:DUF3999 domain-containing protein [Desulfuromonas sp. AOP6]|uniref:DUF3999 domain-containing protein n=1 Tax=Desulfuromonas sp. AOP6 TaxID=1566351 RepID=UPI00128680AE|nr:DUF3999 domain-containing protein [Desulfuromonas sp. AOP6]BCA80613.1 membrane protein [Desulfuromonas sp. AOP6]
MKILFATLILPLVLAGASGPAAAAPTPDAFAYGLPLETTEDNALIEVILPLAVYQGVTRDDLGDLRVFNADDQVVPHTLRQPIRTRQSEETLTTELPFFPLRGEAAPIGSDLSLRVERSAEGTIVDVRANESASASNDPPVAAYLIDASALEDGIDGLKLSWQQTEANFLGQAILEASDDLKVWRPLATAAVANLTWQGHHLEQQKISLPRTRATYLRLRWPAGQEPLALASVAVVTRTDIPVAQPPRQSFEQEAMAIAGEPGSYRVDLDGAVPIDSVRIRLPGNNTLAQVRLFSGATREQPGHERWRGMVYTLNIRGQELRNDAIMLPPTRHRHWLLTFEQNGETTHPTPVLEFGWQPDTLVFLAQGAGPFRLAYGSGQVSAPNTPVEAFLRANGNGKTPGMTPAAAIAGEPYVLGGEERLQPAPLPIPWKKYLLWGILVGGVLLIGVLAASLHRQMHANQGKP